MLGKKSALRRQARANNAHKRSKHVFSFQMFPENNIIGMMKVIIVIHFSPSPYTKMPSILANIKHCLIFNTYAIHPGQYKQWHPPVHRLYAVQASLVVAPDSSTQYPCFFPDWRSYCISQHLCYSSSDQLYSLLFSSFLFSSFITLHSSCSFRGCPPHQLLVTGGH